MHSYVSLRILALLIFIAQGCSRQTAVEFERREIDLGEVVHGTNVLGSVVFRNNTKSHVLIESIETSCGCISVQAEKDSLAPGEDATLAFSLSATGLISEQVVHKDVRITFRPPSVPSRNLTITAKIVPLVKLSHEELFVCSQEPSFIEVSRVGASESEFSTLLWRSNLSGISIEEVSRSRDRRRFSFALRTGINSIKDQTAFLELTRVSDRNQVVGKVAIEADVATIHPTAYLQNLSDYRQVPTSTTEKSRQTFWLNRVHGNTIAIEQVEIPDALVKWLTVRVNDDKVSFDCSLLRVPEQTILGQSLRVQYRLPDTGLFGYVSLPVIVVGAMQERRNDSENPRASSDP